MQLILVRVPVKVAYRSMTVRVESYFHATYLSRSISECCVSVNESYRLKVHSYLYATSPGESVCVSGLLVQTSTDCSHRAITVQLILVKVPAKVDCPSTTSTD